MKGAIFDLDGTILDSMHFWESFCLLYLQGKGIKTSDDINSEVLSMTLARAAQYVAKNFVPHLAEKEILEEWDNDILYAYQNTIPLKPSVREYLHALKKLHVPCCVATLTDKRHAVAALAHHEIYDLFDFVLTVGDVSRDKRFPDIYLKASDKLGVPVQECVVFEDTLYAAKTAKSAGFTVYGIYDQAIKDKESEMALVCDRYIKSFSELI